MSARKAMSPQRRPELVAAEVIHDSWDYIAGRSEKVRQLIFYSHLGRRLPARVGQEVKLEGYQEDWVLAGWKRVPYNGRRNARIQACLHLADQYQRIKAEHRLAYNRGY